MRDALHLVPGARLTLRQEGREIVMEHEAPPRGLYFKSSIPVYDGGTALAHNAADWLEGARDARAEELTGAWPQR